MMEWKRLFPGLSAGASTGGPGDYRAYTTEFDRVATAAELRAELDPEDRQWADELATRYRAKVDLWGFDPRFEALLGRDEAPPPAPAPEGACATILIDQSGSLGDEDAILTCLTAEMVAETWARLGVRTEVLGFTTASWKGGNARARWQALGKPANPGRLCDLLHVVYKGFDEPTSDLRRNLPLMLLHGFRKENVDGEALGWAAGRLEAEEAARRVLLVISDGAPVDDSTLEANHPSILWDHLQTVIRHLSDQPGFTLAAVGIKYDCSRLYARSVTVDRLGQVAAEVLPFATALVRGDQDPPR